MTISKFLEEYGVSKSHLRAFDLTYYQITRYGDIDLEELPVDIHMKFMAVLTRYGYFCEGCKSE